MIHIGFIGSGRIGKPIANNILAAGYAMTVYDLRPEVVAEFIGQGALSAQAPREVAQRAGSVRVGFQENPRGSGQNA